MSRSRRPSSITFGIDASNNTDIKEYFGNQFNPFTFYAYRSVGPWRGYKCAKNVQPLNYGHDADIEDIIIMSNIH